MRPVIDAAPSRWLAILITLALAGCTRSASEAGGGGRAAATQFLDELRAGRLEPAWKGTSAEFKSLMGLENLRDYAKAHPALRSPAEFTESRAVDQGGRALTECRFHASPRVRGKPRPATIKVLLTPGDNRWEVEQLAVE